MVARRFGQLDGERELPTVTFDFQVERLAGLALGNPALEGSRGLDRAAVHLQIHVPKQLASRRSILAAALSGDGQFLTVTERGFGKRTAVEEYPRQGRGGSGVINMRVGEKNGEVVNTCHVQGDACVMLITAQGKLIKLYVDQIRNTQSRAALGVKCIGLEEGDFVTSMTVAVGEEPSEEEPGNDAAPPV